MMSGDIHLLCKPGCIPGNHVYHLDETRIFIRPSFNTNFTNLNTDTPGKISEKIYSIKDLVKRLKWAFFYIVIFILFMIAFDRIVPYYMNEPEKWRGPIDMSAWVFKDIPHEYVKAIKENNVYKIPAYKRSFVLLDLVYPIVYTLMFLTLLNVRKNGLLHNGFFRKFYDIFIYLVYMGMIFDYLENIFVFLYLTTQLQISLLVAILTTIKTLLFMLNICAFIIALVRALKILNVNKHLLRKSFNA